MRNGFNVDGIALQYVLCDADYQGLPDVEGYRMGAPSDWPDDMPWAGFALDGEERDDAA